ncbi:MAG: hypothetical protein IJ464_02765 [Alistipes sp.]|nr:hypothetical protein [Alistipes sp.]
MKKSILLITTTMATLLVNAQECVDLGLSVNWAAYNIGAISQEQMGQEFVAGTIHEFTVGLSTKDIKIYDHDTDYSGNSQYDAATSYWGNL